MKLKKGQTVHVGKITYIREIPDDVAVKLGLMKVEKKKESFKK